MKKIILTIGISLALFIAVLAIYYSGKPAAENMEAMYSRAKIFQDSIANQIKSSMDEAATPAPGGPVVPVVDPTAQATATK